MDTTKNLPSTPSVPHWHAGYNQPGYLPEAEPGVYASFETASEALACDIEEHADATQTWADEHDCDDIPCPTYGDDCPWQHAGNLRAERDALLDSDGPEWSGSAGGLAWWVTTCDDADCVVGLVARIADEFSDSQGSALHALAVLGAILPGAAEEAGEQRHTATTEDEPDLDLLVAFIAALGEREPVPGWPGR